MTSPTLSQRFASESLRLHCDEEKFLIDLADFPFEETIRAFKELGCLVNITKQHRQVEVICPAGA